MQEMWVSCKLDWFDFDLPFGRCTGQEYLLLARPLPDWGPEPLFACVPSFWGSSLAPLVS